MKPLSAVRLILVLCAGVFSLLPVQGTADAIVRSQAMFAATIAEIFIEDKQVRVELEIGGTDLETFANLLPDSVYTNVTGQTRPFPERLGEFFSTQLVMATSESEILPGVLTAINPAKRQQRDPITGEVLASDEEETVLRAELLYPFNGEPEYLAIQTALQAASIGFVAYHGSVAINDFRYLAPVQTVELDWKDPWYSSFRRPSLRRAYHYPMSGFLYVEPYEVRKEIILRPKDLQNFVDLGLGDTNVITVDQQPGIITGVQEFLADHLPVSIDGSPAEGELTRINFLERTLKSSRVIDPPEPLDLDSAVIGVIYTFPIDALPQTVTMDWDLWNDRIQYVSAASVDQAGPLPAILDPEYRVLEWKNFLKNPKIPNLVDVGQVPPAWQLTLQQWKLGIVTALLIVTVILTFRLRSRSNLAAATAVGIGLLLAGGTLWLGQAASPSSEKTQRVVSRLLQNIYHAFDYRKEEKIYDVLSSSVEGDLLTQIYLETRKGLVLANQGGARTKVTNVAVAEVIPEDAGQGKINATATWDVTGSVGHWGHVHTRQNRYSAKMLLSPESGNWKIEDLEILEEERVN